VILYVSSNKSFITLAKTRVIFTLSSTIACYKGLKINGKSMGEIDGVSDVD
jgi:hypothetical protein